jgi:maltose alpha-D-glucosyltransferase/alpha-amylase
MTDSLPNLTITHSWQELLQSPHRAALEAALPAYIQPRRWFGGKARGIASAQLIDTIPIAYDTGQATIAMVCVSYGEGSPDTYVLPLAFATGDAAEQLARDLPHAVVAQIQHASGARGVLYDALMDRGFCAALLELIASSGRQAGATGALQASSTSAFARLRNPDPGKGGSDPTPLEPKIVTAEQSNSSIIYGDRLIMKLFRRLEPGLNPDLEIGRFLTEQTSFAHVPPAAGALEYHGPVGEPSSLAFLQGFVPNQGDAWGFTLGKLSEYFAQKLQSPATASAESPLSTGIMLGLSRNELPHPAAQMIGSYLERAQLLGQRTAQLHLALSVHTNDPNFTPEPFTAADQQTLYASMRDRATQSFATLGRVLGSHTLPAGLRPAAEHVLGLQDKVFEHYRALLDHHFTALRTRIHGDYHLGQVLYTGADFMIIDFEGEPARPLNQRRRKGSALQDVAGILRSFHYAPYAVLFGQAPGVAFRDREVAALEPWARAWHRWVSVAFLRAYLATAGNAPFLPAAPEELERLLDAFLLDKAIYELNYELNNRPAWVRIPVEGILQLVTSE